MARIAAVLTCFNRREKTMQCLENLFKIPKKIDVFLVDDGSTDETAKTVENAFPDVKVINGTGNLFWNRGMHKAWAKAAEGDYDFYLWLNDDVILYPNAIDELLECSLLNEHKAIISGLVEDKYKTEILYGGSGVNKRTIQANGRMQEIQFMNGNIVLIPHSVFQTLGNLDARFHHDLGDVDYGLRAKKNNILVLTSRSPIAQGEKNPISRLRLNKSNLRKRFKWLYAPLGNPPAINFYFRKRHYGLLNALVYYMFLHFINIIPDNVNQTLFGKKYQ